MAIQLHGLDSTFNVCRGYFSGLPFGITPTGCIFSIRCDSVKQRSEIEYLFVILVEFCKSLLNVSDNKSAIYIFFPSLYDTFKLYL